MTTYPTKPVGQPSPAERQRFKAQVERHQRVLEEERARTRDKDEQLAQACDERDEARNSAIVLKRAATWPALPADERERAIEYVTTRVEQLRRQHIRSGQGTFLAYKAISEAEHEAGVAAVAPVRDQSPLESVPLPPPTMGRLPHLTPAQNAARAEAQRLAHERGQKLVDQRKTDREQYLAALAKRGLRDPSFGRGL
jgi:hypothetical protein